MDGLPETQGFSAAATYIDNYDAVVAEKSVLLFSAIGDKLVPQQDAVEIEEKLREKGITVLTGKLNGDHTSSTLG